MTQTTDSPYAGALSSGTPPPAAPVGGPWFPIEAFPGRPPLFGSYAVFPYRGSARTV
ncbi:hypothetical protein [Streptomyces sp. NPDC059092]|uniref:hypothetical protein n=1 Tax=Streptomyces sp. NPDC059092 TaxID=3346725 RepID=UPI0036881BB3